MNKLGLVKFSSNSTVPMNDRILIKLIHTQRWAVASNSLVIYITISGNGCLQYEVLHQSMQNTADHSSCVVFSSTQTQTRSVGRNDAQNQQGRPGSQQYACLKNLTSFRCMQVMVNSAHTECIHIIST